MCTALLSISWLLQEDPYAYFVETDSVVESRLVCSTLKSRQDEITSILDENSKFIVTVENITMATSNDFVHAFTLMVASYYIFNLQYRKSSVALLTFIQKFMLALNDSEKTSQSVDFDFKNKKRKYGL